MLKNVKFDQIEIKNYRSIKDATIFLSDYNPLVGYNNAGKTNILRAIFWITKKRVLDEADFHDSGKPVMISATISGMSEPVLSSLEESHQRRISDYVSDDEKIRFRRIQESPNGYVKDIKLEVMNLDEEWVPNPSGIDNAISALFPEAILIEAMDDSAEDVSKNAASSTIGKLIKEIAGKITEKYSGDVKEALSCFQKKIAADGEERDKDLVALDNRIKSQIEKLFPDITAKIHIPVPDISEFFKSATIKVSDTRRGSDASFEDVKSLGHGAQRSIQIALINTLADMKNRNDDEIVISKTLLLIDEPELYLHPQAIEQVRCSLFDLSSGGYQVVFTTHSPSMLSRHEAANTLIIRKKEGETISLKTVKESIEKSIQDADHQASLLFEMGNAAEIFFSDRVLLVEGKTEIAVLPDLFKAITGATLQSERIGLVSMNSVNSIPKAMGILESMGIPAMTIVDLDFIMDEHLTKNLIDKDDKDMSFCKKIMEEKGNEWKVGSKNARLLASEKPAEQYIHNLHNKLIDKRIWLWQKGCIEKHLELESKKTTEHFRFVNGLNNDEEFVKKLHDYSNIENLCHWIKK